MPQLQAHLQSLFPRYVCGGMPSRAPKDYVPYRAPIAHCDKARERLGLQCHDVRDTIRTTIETMVEFDVVKPKLKSAL